MFRISHPLLLAGAIALLPAGPAMAKGGDSAPAPAYVSMCPQDSDWVVQYADGSTSFANESGGGCVWVRSYPAGYLRLDRVDLAPGWTYVVKSNGEGSNSRVQLQFTHTASGTKVDFRVEYGKTRIG